MNKVRKKHHWTHLTLVFLIFIWKHKMILHIIKRESTQSCVSFSALHVSFLFINTLQYMTFTIIHTPPHVYSISSPRCSIIKPSRGFDFLLLSLIFMQLFSAFLNVDILMFWCWATTSLWTVRLLIWNTWHIGDVCRKKKKCKDLHQSLKCAASCAVCCCSSGAALCLCAAGRLSGS